MKILDCKYLSSTLKCCKHIYIAIIKSYTKVIYIPQLQTDFNIRADTISYYFKRWMIKRNIMWSNESEKKISVQSRILLFYAMWYLYILTRPNGPTYHQAKWNSLPTGTNGPTCHQAKWTDIPPVQMELSAYRNKLTDMPPGQMDRHAIGPNGPTYHQAKWNSAYRNKLTDMPSGQMDRHTIRPNGTLPTGTNWPTCHPAKWTDMPSGQMELCLQEQIDRHAIRQTKMPLNYSCTLIQVVYTLLTFFLY